MSQRTEYTVHIHWTDDTEEGVEKRHVYSENMAGAIGKAYGICDALLSPNALFTEVHAWLGEPSSNEPETPSPGT